MPSAIFPALCLPRLDLQLPRRFQSLRLRPPVLFLHHLRTHRHLRRRFRCHHHQGPFPHHHSPRFQLPPPDQTPRHHPFRLRHPSQCHRCRRARRGPTSWSQLQTHQHPRSPRFRHHQFPRRPSLLQCRARNQVPRLRVRGLVHPFRRPRRRNACSPRLGSFAASCSGLRRSP